MNTNKSAARSVRPSPIAGRWYPGDARTLAETVDDYLAAADRIPMENDPLALLAPHAGYPYSGPTAACAYRQLSGRSYDLVILLGPSHYENYGPVAISNKQYYATPLGEIELDQEFILALERRISVARFGDDQEHSLEIQLPFLQRVLTGFKLVPIMLQMPLYYVGPTAFKACSELATGLADLAQGHKVLFVASSDLSHLQDYRQVAKNDALTARLIEAMYIPGLVNHMSGDGECRACGDAAIITALLAALQLGADHATVIHRTDSSLVTGERLVGQYTVGYLAAAVWKSKS